MNHLAFLSNSLPEFVVERLSVPYGIGLFIKEWTIHERKIVWLVAYESGEHPNAVRDRMVRKPTSNFNTVLKKLKEKYATHERVVKHLSQLLAEQEKAIENRHDIVHGFWEGADEQGHYVKRLDKAGAGYVRHFTAAELCEMADHVHSLGLEMMRVSNEIAKTRNHSIPYPAIDDDGF